MEGYRVKKLRHAFAAYREGYVSALLEMIHPECLVDFEEPLAQSGIWHGPHGVVLMVGEWEESFSHVELEPLQFIEVGTCVVVPVSYTTRGLSEGRSVDDELTHVFRFRGPMIVEWRIFRDMRLGFTFADGTIGAPAAS